MRFHILGSSSAGNCALLETGSSRILIDAGFTGKRICQMLAARNLDIESIDAVFLTHEHGDHISGVKGLSRAAHLQFFSTMATAKAVQRNLSREVSWKLFDAGSSFQFRDLTIQTFPLPHDAYDPVGYVFRCGGDDLFNPHRSVAWLTDLGYVPSHCANLVRDVNILVLEANYDVAMLENDQKRPFALKQRIRGRHGHLSNEAALQFMNSITDPSWETVYLAHLSRDCNDVNLVRSMFCQHSRNYRVEVIDPCCEALNFQLQGSKPAYI
jgi:phosphoribosyl 1,2-cyclic phosphodiesterase